MKQPKYEIIKQDIIEKINTGEFEPGKKIYSEGELKKIYDVSSTTVVRALQDLVLEGYLIRRQGEGTYVRRNLRHKKVYFDEHGPLIKQDVNKETSEKTITMIHRKVIQKEVAKKLELEEKTNLAQIVQLAMIDNDVWKIQIRFISDDMLTDEMEQELKAGDSLSEKYKKQQQLTHLPMEQEIKFSLLGNEGAVLNLIPGEVINIEWPINLPVVKFIKRYFNNHKKPIEVSYTLIHYKHYAININFEGI